MQATDSILERVLLTAFSKAPAEPSESVATPCKAPGEPSAERADSISRSAEPSPERADSISRSEKLSDEIPDSIFRSGKLRAMFKHSKIRFSFAFEEMHQSFFASRFAPPALSSRSEQSPHSENGYEGSVIETALAELETHESKVAIRE